MLRLWKTPASEETADGLCQGRGDRMPGQHGIKGIPQVVARGVVAPLPKSEVEVVNASPVEQSPMRAEHSSLGRDGHASPMHQLVGRVQE